MDRDSFFDNLRRDDTVQDELRRAQRQLAYEERVIKRVFTECGIKIGGWGRFANQCRATTNQDRLNFEWFNSEFRRFPAVLSGRRIPGLHKISVQDLFKPSDKNRLVKAVVKALARNEVQFEDNRWVFVFSIVKTFFVAHNLDLEIPGASWVLRNNESRLQLGVSPTKPFFSAIGSAWFES